MSSTLEAPVPSPRRPRSGRRLAAFLLLIATVAMGCSSVTERVDNARSTVGGVAERARVCVDLAQTFAAIEDEGTEADPEQALATLRELAERSPEAVDALMGDLETLVRRAAEIEARGDSPVADPEFRSAAQRVASRAVALCATG